MAATLSTNSAKQTRATVVAQRQPRQRTATVELHSFLHIWTKATVVRTTGMPNLSRNCTCGITTGFLRCLANGTRRNNDGQVNLVQELHLWNLHGCRPHTGHDGTCQELHLWNLHGFRRRDGQKRNQKLHLWTVRRKPGTCRCIVTGIANMSRNCVISKQFSHCLDQKPCRCTTGTTTTRFKNCTCLEAKYASVAGAKEPSTLHGAVERDQRELQEFRVRSPAPTAPAPTARC